MSKTCLKQSSYTMQLARIGMIIFGNILYALTVRLFLLPSGLITGGTTGIALALNRMIGIPLSPFVLGFNVLMLVIGWLIIGKKFALTTIISTFVYPIALGMLEQMIPDIHLTEDMILNTVFCGLGIGISLGIVIRCGASTGGMDIPPLVLNRWFGIPVSVSLYVFDVIILMGQCFDHTAEQILYGVLLVIVYTIVLDKLMLFGTTRTEVKIVSSKMQEIRKAILEDVDRGLTLLNGKTGYLDHDTQMILSIISNRELPAVERLVHEIDPECFMVISRVTEVSGRGFTLGKHYEKRG